MRGWLGSVAAAVLVSACSSSLVGEPRLDATADTSFETNPDAAIDTVLDAPADTRADGAADAISLVDAPAQNVCGANGCEENESCVSCPEDCGSCAAENGCPAPDTPGLMLCEDFDDKDLTASEGPYGGSGIKSEVVDSHVICGAGYVEGYGGSGSAWAVPASGTGLCCDDRLAWFATPRPWPSNVLYFRVLMRYASFEATGTSNFGLKLFYPHFSGGYVAYQEHNLGSAYIGAMGGDGSSHLMVSSGCVDDRYFGTPDIHDGNWHQFDTYINFATGQVRVWVDNVLRHDMDASQCDCWDSGCAWDARPDVSNVSFPSIADAKCTNESHATFQRLIDNWQVWDRVPGT